MVTFRGDKDLLSGDFFLSSPWATKILYHGPNTCNRLHGQLGSHLGDATHVIASMGGKDPIFGIQRI